MNTSQNIISVCLLFVLVSNTAVSKKILTEKIKTDTFNFDSLRAGWSNIRYNIKHGIQYGTVDLQNGKQVKFWFLSHHATSDIGGTIYEYPDGEQQFCGGFHCCEVQFPDNNSDDKGFKNEEEFNSYVTENN